MERTYVFNFIFKVMAVAGIIAAFGIAGTSDLGTFSNAEVLIYSGISFLASAIGVWGATNCTRAIEAMKRRERRIRARAFSVVYGSKAA